MVHLIKISCGFRAQWYTICEFYVIRLYQRVSPKVTFHKVLKLPPKTPFKCVKPRFKSTVFKDNNFQVMAFRFD